MRSVYAIALFKDDAATLVDLREAVATLEDTVRIAQQVPGATHPTTAAIEDSLQKARAKLLAQSKT